PVRGRARVVQVAVGERGQLAGEPGVVRVLLGVKSQIFEQEGLPRLERAGARERLRAHAVWYQLDSLAQERLEPVDDRTQRILACDLSLRPPEVRGEHDPRAGLDGVLNRRHDRAPR